MSTARAADPAPDGIRHLTRPVLEDLVGTTTVRRGAAYQRNRAVRSLGYGLDGDSLVATVQGSRRYTTVVASERVGRDAAVSDALASRSSAAAAARWATAASTSSR